MLTLKRCLALDCHAKNSQSGEREKRRGTRMFHPVAQEPHSVPVYQISKSQM